MSLDVFFAAIVAISVGIAGFAGIVAAVQQRDLKIWPARNRILVQILFFSSAVAILFALLPSISRAAGVGANVTWIIGSAGLSIWFVGAGTYRVRQSKRLGATLALPPGMLVWLVAATALQIYNLAVAQTSWPYLVGVLALNVNGYTAFLLLLLGPERADEGSA